MSNHRHVPKVLSSVLIASVIFELLPDLIPVTMLLRAGCISINYSFLTRDIRIHTVVRFDHIVLTVLPAF